jgi:hypothetical protein
MQSKISNGEAPTPSYADIKVTRDDPSSTNSLGPSVQKTKFKSCSHFKPAYLSVHKASNLLALAAWIGGVIISLYNGNRKLPLAILVIGTALLFAPIGFLGTAGIALLAAIIWIANKADKRELIDTGTDKRFVRRNSKGQFKESDDVGRSLAADRRKKAKTKIKTGQGDRG